MSESATHVRLVEVMVDYVNREFCELDNVSLYVDTSAIKSRALPPRIGGYVPDIFARDVPQTRTLIGEAKTRQDLETERSHQQLHAFLEYLCHTPNGIFVLCVPTIARATARVLLNEINVSLPGNETITVVLDPSGRAAH